MSLTNSQSVAMDVDGPSNGPGTLKRCSSAPMINESTAVMTAVNPSTSNREPQPFSQLFGSSSQTRTRRFSASFSQVPGSPVSGPRLAPRINQLRQEEHDGISNTRELAHEREIHHAMQISQSWEDLSLMNDGGESKPANKMAPLQISLPSSCAAVGGGFMCNSPSPTRMGFQSPTRSRTIIRRSASPVLRPSPLGVKRKLDDDKQDFHASPRAKRVYSYSGVGPDRGGLLATAAAAPGGASLPGSLSSVGTPESLSSADSPGFNFRSVDSPSPGRAIPGDALSSSKNDQEMAEGPS